jgi:hypothetical protein
MGFRDYSPGLNRFLTRDMYNGALADLNLSTNQFTSNRYAFGAGNPISMVELDGHIPLECTTGELDCTTTDSGGWRVEPSGCQDIDCVRARNHEATQRAGGDSGDRPEISQGTFDQILEEAEQLLTEGDGVGFCAEAGYSIVLAGGTGQGCLVKAGDEYGLVGFLSGDFGWYQDLNVHGTLQTVYSSAESLDDLRGPSVCFSVSGGEGAVVQGGVCASFSSDDMSDLSSVSVIAGVGLGAGVDAPTVGPSQTGGLQFGYTGATELRWLESAVEGTVDHVDETTGWSDFWEAVHNPRAWMG